MNRAEVGVLSFIDTLAAIAQSNDRAQVRDAGAIAPLVALLVSGTGEVPGRCASVLRDLAQHSAMRVAILEADGIQRLVHMLTVESKAIVVEAADALRSLCAGSMPVCAEVKKHNGVRALVNLLGEDQHPDAALHAAGTLSHIAQVEPSTRRGMGDAGAVRSLVRMLSSGFAHGSGSGKQSAAWATSKSCEIIIDALVVLMGEPACLPLLYKETGAVRSLTQLMLRSGLQSSAAAHAAGLLASLLRSDKSGEDNAMRAMLSALTEISKDEEYGGHGWSLRFSELRTMLQAHVEKRLIAVEDGASAADMQKAMGMAKAAEMPQQRLDAARSKYEEAQAKRKREGMAAKAEERRVQKEEEVAARKAEKKAIEEEVMAEMASEDETIPSEAGRKKGRKDAVPSRFVPKSRLAPGHEDKRRMQGAQGTNQGMNQEMVFLQQQLAEQATVSAMQAMEPTLRDRMVKRMVRAGQLAPTSRGRVAEYAASLGLLEQQAATPSGMTYDLKNVRDGTMQSSNRAGKDRNARNSLAERAAQRRLAGMLQPSAGQEDDDDDGSSYTGSSYSGTTIDDSDEDEPAPKGRPAARATAAKVFPAKPNHQLFPFSGPPAGKPSPFSGKIGLAPPKKGSKVPASKTAKGSDAISSVRGGGSVASAVTDRGPSRAGGTGLEISTPRKNGWMQGLFPHTGGGAEGGGAEGAGADGQKKKKHRRHKRKKGGKGDAKNGVLVVATQLDLGMPSYMLPVFTKLQQRAAEQAMFGAPPNFYRNRWEEKFVPGGFGGELGYINSPPTSARVDRAASDLSEFTTKSGTEWASLGASSAAPLRDTMRSSLTESHVSLPPSNWGVVRDRLGDINQFSVSC
jgi:hypothetical protein